MVAKLDGGCLVVALKEGEPARDGSLRIWKHFGREAGAKAISLRVLELPAGERATLRNESSDEVLYVVAGSGTAGDSAISADSGIYLPPSASLDIAATETLILVSSQCPDDGAVLEGYEQGSGAPFVVAMRDRPVERTGDRWYREIINANDGSTQVTQFVGGIPPGRAPDHFHLYEEVIVILDGTGVMWAGTSNTPIETGSCIFLPLGQVHCVENRGDGEMQLLGVFYPAGSPAVRYGANAKR
ncbi:MAG TPA: cupin domain-containing protein [Thermoanaerobaculia bacterium]|jgi:mannose-6-phosphate isomerase-like protein (cupin superfamily)|nr:cupin domain-containing protein [Thermoanaerobaculia bacterium]